MLLLHSFPLSSPLPPSPAAPELPALTPNTHPPREPCFPQLWGHPEGTTPDKERSTRAHTHTQSQTCFLDSPREGQALQEHKAERSSPARQAQEEKRQLPGLTFFFAQGLLPNRLPPPLLPLLPLSQQPKLLPHTHLPAQETWAAPAHGHPAPQGSPRHPSHGHRAKKRRRRRRRQAC